MAGNDAEGKQPTMEEEMAKFQGFAVRDGEVDGGEATEAERAAAAANASTHAENQARAAGKEPAAGKTAAAPKAADKTAPAAGTTAKVELTDAERAAAITAAATAAGVAESELDEAAIAEAESKAVAAKAKVADRETRKKSADIRFAEITRARRTAERENAAKDQRIAQLEADMAALKAGKQPTPLTPDPKDAKTAASGKPDARDTAKYQYGELDPQYIADLARWSTLEAFREAKESDANNRNSAANAEAKAAFDEKVAAFDRSGLELYDDFDTVVIESRDLPHDDPGYWPLSPALGELLLESEHGTTIAYELASNPAEARRINALPPLRQATWFGIREAELIAGSGANAEQDPDASGAAARQAAAAKAPVQVSKAPLPLPSAKKLNGAGGNRVPDAATTDFRAFEAQAMAPGRSN
jgi:hypothetical protein